MSVYLGVEGGRRGEEGVIMEGLAALKLTLFKDNDGRCLTSERHDGEILKLGIVKTKQRRSFRNKGAKRDRLGGWVEWGEKKRVDLSCLRLWDVAEG